jgi:hypothetical protein
MTHVRDFLPALQEAAERLRAAGFAREADELGAVLTGAWTTSSEMLGEIGRTVLRIEDRCGRALPEEVRAACRRAMREIRKVWPFLRA